MYRQKHPENRGFVCVIAALVLVMLTGSNIIGEPAGEFIAVSVVAGAAGNLSDLTTYTVADHMAEFIPALPSETHLATVAADMDRNRNGKIDGDEGQSIKDYLRISSALQILDMLLGSPLNAAMNVLYQNLRKVRGVRVITNTNIFGWIWVDIIAKPTRTNRLNDILVTVNSARGNSDYQGHVDWEVATYSGTSGKTHANVASAEVAKKVAEEFIIPTARVYGDMKKWPSRSPYVPR